MSNTTSNSSEAFVVNDMGVFLCNKKEDCAEGNPYANYGERVRIEQDIDSLSSDEWVYIRTGPFEGWAKANNFGKNFPEMADRRQQLRNDISKNGATFKFCEPPLTECQQITLTTEEYDDTRFRIDAKQNNVAVSIGDGVKKICFESWQFESEQTLLILLYGYEETEDEDCNEKVKEPMKIAKIEFSGDAIWIDQPRLILF